MEAPLAIRAWTLLYSQDKALAEPDDRNRQSSAPLFLYPRAYYDCPLPHRVSVICKLSSLSAGFARKYPFNLNRKQDNENHLITPVEESCPQPPLKNTTIKRTGGGYHVKRRYTLGLLYLKMVHNCHDVDLLSFIQFSNVK